MKCDIVIPTSSPPELQLIELIKLHSDKMLKAVYLNKLLLEYYRVSMSKKKFPNVTFSNGDPFSEARTYANNSFLN